MSLMAHECGALLFAITSVWNSVRPLASEGDS